MIILIAFAFIAGIVTILSPCILPVLPIILSGAAGGGKKKPLGIVTGFVASFTFFTLFLTSLVQAFGVSADTLRIFSVVVLFVFGLSLLLPFVQVWLEKGFTVLSGKVPNRSQSTTFGGGVLIGASLGLLWTPCVGPILASVLSLALTGTVTGSAALITLAYALGTSLPMLAIMIGGQELLRKNTWLLQRTSQIQRGFGVLMMATAVAIFFNLDRQFQSIVLEAFPKYGTGLTKFEENAFVKEQLEDFRQGSDASSKGLLGKPSPVGGDDYGEAPELIAGGEWINSEPMTLAELRGKVVLIDFWTYSCINCIRTLPYLAKWHETYADQGLVIIGVHTPEFEFEKELKNVQTAAKDFGLEYPIMQDNNFATWKAFNNRYWPAKYLIDAEGHIRYFHFGEQGYDETESKIQELLKEAGSMVEETVQVENETYQVYGRTPELYLGYERMQALVFSQKVQKDQAIVYAAPQALPQNTFSLEGEWLVTPEYSQASEGSQLNLSFNAKKVFLVMRTADDSEGSVIVSSNGKELGVISVSQDKLYQVIELEQPGEGRIQLEFLDPNIQIFAFTFG